MNSKNYYLKIEIKFIDDIFFKYTQLNETRPFAFVIVVRAFSTSHAGKENSEIRHTSYRC